MIKISDFFYTETEAAKFLGVSRITIWRWIKQGKLDAQRVGGVVFIPKWQMELMRTESQNVGV
jgi:excisionase family DNA binding protein